MKLFYGLCVMLISNAPRHPGNTGLASLCTASDQLKGCTGCRKYRTCYPRTLIDALLPTTYPRFYKRGIAGRLSTNQNRRTWQPKGCIPSTAVEPAAELSSEFRAGARCRHPDHADASRRLSQASQMKEQSQVAG
jgi:hypothetical protein